MSTSVENVVCFGDSVAYGYGTETRMGWVELLKRHFFQLNRMHRDEHACFFDLTIPGESSITLNERVDWATDHKPGAASTKSLLYRLNRKNLTVLSIGGQDIYRVLRERGDLSLSMMHFTRAVGAIANRLVEMGSVLYVGPPAPRKEIAERSIHGRNVTVEALFQSYEVAAANAVASAALRSGQEYKVVSLFEATVGDPAYQVGRDGNHPTEEGHKVIFDIIRPTFDTMVGVHNKM